MAAESSAARPHGVDADEGQPASSRPDGEETATEVPPAIVDSWSLRRRASSSSFSSSSSSSARQQRRPTPLNLSSATPSTRPELERALTWACESSYGDQGPRDESRTPEQHAQLRTARPSVGQQEAARRLSQVLQDDSGAPTSGQQQHHIQAAEELETREESMASPIPNSTGRTVAFDPSPASGTTSSRSASSNRPLSPILTPGGPNGFGGHVRIPTSPLSGAPSTFGAASTPSTASASTSAAPSPPPPGALAPPGHGKSTTGYTQTLASPCFVHSHLDHSLSDFIKKEDEARRRAQRRRERQQKAGAGESALGSDGDEEDSGTATESEGSDELNSLTRQLAETAVSVREMSKQLGRARVKSQTQSVMIVTKARDNHLIRLTREIALYLMRTPRNGRDRGLVVYVDSQLKKSKRFDAEGMERSEPDLFRPFQRRYSRTSSYSSLHTQGHGSGFDSPRRNMPGMTPFTTSLSTVNEGLKRRSSTDRHSSSGSTSNKQQEDEGQLRYWTNEMCTKSPHLFDFVITLGGDGTVLYTSWLFQHVVPPVIPFALGSLGFLTNFDFSNYASVMDSAIDSGVRVNLRMRFTCTVYRAVEGLEDCRKRKAIRSGKTGEIFMRSLDQDGWEALEGGVQHPNAQAANGQQPDGTKDKEVMCFSTRPVESFEVLNDLVVDRGPSPYVSLLELFGDEHHMTTVQADGLTVSTPTGSTAYSLSAGGSLVHPEIPALLITPICPHTLSFRPMLLPDSMELRICVPYNSRSTAWASFDGRGRVELRQGDHIKVTASQYPFPTVCADKQSTDWFHAIARTLKWNERQRQKSFVILEEGRQKDRDTRADQAAAEQGFKAPSSGVAASVAVPADNDTSEDAEGEDDEDETYDIDDLSSNPTTVSSPMTEAYEPKVPVPPLEPSLDSKIVQAAAGDTTPSLPSRTPSSSSEHELHRVDSDRFRDPQPRPPPLSSRHTTGSLSAPPTQYHHRLSKSTMRRREKGEEGDRDHIREPIDVKRDVGGSAKRPTPTSRRRAKSQDPHPGATSWSGGVPLHDASQDRAFAVFGHDFSDNSSDGE